MALALVRNITESKLTEFSSSVIDHISTAVLLFSENRSLVGINLAAQEMLGIGPASSLGKKLEELFFASSPIVDICNKTFTHGSGYDCYADILRKSDAIEIKVIAKSSLLESDSKYAVLELINISQNDALRDERFYAQQQLNKKIARQLAHEIKNPLGGLRGAAQLLERKLPDENLHKYTDIIIEESDRLTKLVDSILLSSGKPDTKVINPHEITERVLALFEKQEGTSLKITKDYDPSLPNISVDFNQVVQAYLNLAKNALEAIEGVADGKVVFKTRIEYNRIALFKRYPVAVVLSVVDNGPGIPQDLQENIFYPLVSTKDNGSGLGLTISQGQVERNGGSIELKSHPGQTIFSMIFPASDMERE